MTDIEQEWRGHARRLADMLALPDSRWHEPITRIPRHRLIPRWLERHPEEPAGWVVRHGENDSDKWIRTAYFQTASVITKVGPHHADTTPLFQTVTGRQTSSGTNPWRILEMYRAARIHPKCGDVLDVGTGPGYGCALLSRLMGADRVTTVDVDPYITKVAGDRFAALGLSPRIITGDATGPLDWEGERIVATVAVPSIPAGWLAALKPGGRFAVNIAGTLITITGRKMPDGTAWGRVEHDQGGFMHTRGPDDFPATRVPAVFTSAAHADGETRTSLFPVFDLDQAAELSSLFALHVPGVEWRYELTEPGSSTALLAHPDGSWARAEGQPLAPATIHQGGPRRLWDALDKLRADWLVYGSLHLFGAEVRIQPDGEATVNHGPWSLTIPAGRSQSAPPDDVQPASV